MGKFFSFIQGSKGMFIFHFTLNISLWLLCLPPGYGMKQIKEPLISQDLWRVIKANSEWQILDLLHYSLFILYFQKLLLFLDSVSLSPCQWEWWSFCIAKQLISSHLIVAMFLTLSQQAGNTWSLLLILTTLKLVIKATELAHLPPI